MTLLDLKEYIAMKERVYADYEDRKAWSKKMLVNIAKAGFFSSDRTITQYNEEIWKLQRTILLKQSLKWLCFSLLFGQKTEVVDKEDPENQECEKDKIYMKKIKNQIQLDFFHIFDIMIEVRF